MPRLQVNQNAETQPTAPPIYLMPDANQQQEFDPQVWGPPPRYEEATGGDTSSRVAGQSTRLPLHTSQVTASAAPSNPRSASRTSQNQNNADRSQQQRQSSLSMNRDRERDRSPRSSSRLRSASPSGLSENDQRKSSPDNEGPNKKRGSTSKIKKGLESIAFFIIQILD